MMKYYTEYDSHEVESYTKQHKLYDNTIYTLDIETTSFIVLDNKVYSNEYYDKLSNEEKDKCKKYATMYIWQLSINEDVYYGRTYEELEDFLNILENNFDGRKLIFVHNLSYEFQFLSGYFKFCNIRSRKKRKVMECELSNYNIIFRCTLSISNRKLDNLAKTYALEYQKQVGSLKYEIIRNSLTPLTEQELKYCEYDCLVVYAFIKNELKTYEHVFDIPITSTGYVRRELKELTIKDIKYKDKVRKAINVDPHIYNMLVKAFQGGYTHANFTNASKIHKNVDSYDETSEYPYVMVSEKYPSTQFKKCNIKKKEDMLDRFAYLIKLVMTNVKSRYYNTFISISRCVRTKNVALDNGRILRADYVEIYCTDIDLQIYLDAYECDYEIVESYYSVYKYLPKKLIDFILDKYVKKTEYKDVEDKKVEYQLEKSKFNSIYGMSVTNVIRDHVCYDNEKGWYEEKLTNEEIVRMLNEEYKKGFLSFSYGVWVTAYARRNLLNLVMKYDDYVIYCDTDSIKLKEGYDPKYIEEYNKSVIDKIKNVSEKMQIDINRYQPTDIKGNKHLLGLFDCETKKGYEHTYDEFITHGAKKYAYKLDDKCYITVAGVPKNGASQLKTLEEFQDGYIFKYENTGNMLSLYNDNQEEFLLTDYLGNEYKIKDKKVVVLLPNSYTLARTYDYMQLISDYSNGRRLYDE